MYIYTCTYRFQEFGPFLKQRPQIKRRLTEKGVSLGNILWRFQAPAAGRVFHPLTQTSPCGSWRNLRVWLQASSSGVSRWFIDKGFSEGNTDVYRRFHCTGSDLLPSYCSVTLCQSHSSHQMAWVVHISKPRLARHFLSFSLSLPLQGRNTSSHHYHDICKLRWWFSNCEFWYGARCFNYCRALLQDLATGGICPQKTLCVWSYGLSWNWKWMVINYNDDHCGEKVSCHRLLDDVDSSAWGEKKVKKNWCDHCHLRTNVQRRNDSQLTNSDTPTKKKQKFKKKWHLQTPNYTCFPFQIGWQWGNKWTV